MRESDLYKSLDPSGGSSGLEGNHGDASEQAQVVEPAVQRPLVQSPEVMEDFRTCFLLLCC